MGLSNSRDLLLPDLLIKGFRGIEQLSIPRLGRVNLFVGKNGTGKTTLLDAIRVYAGRGSWLVVEEILRRHNEVLETTDEDGGVRIEAPNWNAIFHGRRDSSSGEVSIGPADSQLQIHLNWKGSNQSAAKHLSEDYGEPSLNVRYCGSTIDYHVGNRRNRTGAVGYGADPSLPPVIACQSAGPSVLSNWEIARLWDGVALTEDENKVVDALNLIFSHNIERIAVIGDDTAQTTRSSGRRPVVKIKSTDRPVPLRSLGDGATRMFSAALALANSKDGFLLVDEAENGIHYSVQTDFWKMVMRTAEVNNVQVFATTHSWDCFTGFAHAAAELGKQDVSLSRIERIGDEASLMTYPVEDIEVAAEHGIEVR